MPLPFIEAGIASLAVIICIVLLSEEGILKGLSQISIRIRRGRLFLYMRL